MPCASGEGLEKFVSPCGPWRIPRSTLRRLCVAMVTAAIRACASRAQLSALGAALCRAAVASTSVANESELRQLSDMGGKKTIPTEFFDIFSEVVGGSVVPGRSSTRASSPCAPSEPDVSVSSWYELGGRLGEQFVLESGSGRQVDSDGIVDERVDLARAGQNASGTVRSMQPQRSSSKPCCGQASPLSCGGVFGGGGPAKPGGPIVEDAAGPTVDVSTMLDNGTRVCADLGGSDEDKHTVDGVGFGAVVATKKRRPKPKKHKPKTSEEPLVWRSAVPNKAVAVSMALVAVAVLPVQMLQWLPPLLLNSLVGLGRCPVLRVWPQSMPRHMVYPSVRRVMCARPRHTT